MITIFVSANFGRHIQRFLNSWAPDSRPEIVIRSYADIEWHKPIPAGTYVLTDFERLTTYEMDLVKVLYNHLNSHPEIYRVFNDPHIWLNRFELNQVLFQKKLSSFRSFRIDAVPEDVTFPVFLRRDNDHVGNRSDLLNDKEEVDRAMKKQTFINRLFFKPHFMIVEFGKSSVEKGHYKKFSVMRMGDAYIYRHILFSKNWMTKYPEVVDQEKADEELRFVNEKPYLDSVKKSFDLAGLVYGRIDFGVNEGQVNVWEINSNPVLVPDKSRVDPLRMKTQQLSADLILDTFSAWNDSWTPSNTTGKRVYMSSRKYCTAKAIQCFSRWYNKYRR